MRVRRDAFVSENACRMGERSEGSLQFVTVARARYTGPRQSISYAHVQVSPFPRFTEDKKKFTLEGNGRPTISAVGSLRSSTWNTCARLIFDSEK